MQKFRKFRASCLAGAQRRKGGETKADLESRAHKLGATQEIGRQILQGRLTFFILERQTDFPSRLIKSHPPSLLAVSQLDNMKTEA